MKKSLTLSACVSLLGLITLPAFADDDTPLSCTLATLHGTYASGGWGTNTTNSYLSSSTDMESFDGKGHVKYYQIYSDSTGTTIYTGTGTYVMTSPTDPATGITASCVAQVTYSPSGHAFTYFVAPDGGAFYWNQNRPGTQAISGGRYDRISVGMLVR